MNPYAYKLTYDNQYGETIEQYFYSAESAAKYLQERIEAKQVSMEGGLPISRIELNPEQEGK